MSEPLTSKDLVVGGFYNWKGQPERLSYIGAQRYNGDSRTWHQFALVDVPGVCWCEVLDWQLNLFEVTECAAVQAAQPEAVGEWKRVPVEPTEAMIAAIYGGGMANLSEFDLRRIRTQAKLDWAAMLASAPTPEPMSAPTEAKPSTQQASGERDHMAGVEIFRLDANINGVDHQLVEFARYEDHARVVHNLETICDPAGLVRENAQLRDTNEGLQRMYRAALSTPAQQDAVDAQLLTEREQRAVLEDPGMLVRLIGFHDCEEAAGEAMEEGWGKYHERRALELLEIGRKVIAEDPGIWEPEIIAEFKPRHSERAAISAKKVGAA